MMLKHEAGSRDKVHRSERNKDDVGGGARKMKGECCEEADQ